MRTSSFGEVGLAWKAAVGLLLLAGCGSESPDPNPEDIAGDAAYHAVAESGLESRVEDVEGQADALHALVEAQGAVIEAQAAQIDNLTAAVADLEARLTY
jgi:uncharacterized lipoprotein YmbA